MKIEDIERLYSDDTKKKVMADIEEIAGVYVFDPNAAYCDEVSCDYTIGGLPVFRDVYQHASVHLNQLVLPDFDRFLGTIGAEE